MKNNKKLVLLDCPGYSDSKGSFLVITNAYFHYRVFSKVQNLKFILAIDANNLTGDYMKVVNTLEHFFKSFKLDKFDQIKDDVFASTVFIFTKIDERGIKNINNRLKQLREVA